MIFSCTGHLRKNTLSTFKQHSEKSLDYIGVIIANHKNKNLKFLRHMRFQLNSNSRMLFDEYNERNTT